MQFLKNFREKLGTPLQILLTFLYIRILTVCYTLVYKPNDSISRCCNSQPDCIKFQSCVYTTPTLQFISQLIRLYRPWRHYVIVPSTGPEAIVRLQRYGLEYRWLGTLSCHCSGPDCRRESNPVAQPEVYVRGLPQRTPSYLMEAFLLRPSHIQ